MNRWLRKGYLAIRLILSFFRELWLSNLTVARIVLSPKVRIRPGIVAYHTRLRTDVGITTLANLITLTPGTLTLDLSKDRSTLYIHTINVDWPEQVSATIRHAFEDYLLELEE